MNIVLIGMPGAGKSTIGRKLAKKMGFDFIDTDDVIKERTDKPLQELVEELGSNGFIEKEGQIISSLFLDNFVVATGGSAVLSEKAMEHLKKNSIIIYLKISFYTMKQRIGNAETRGIAIDKDSDLYKLYQTRVPLYEKYADIVLKSDKKTKHQMVINAQKAIEDKLNTQ